MDFTIKKYKQLFTVLQSQGFFFQTFADFLNTSVDIGIKEKTIVLRHDVDLLPNNSLQFAKIQAEFNIKGSYFFRAVPESWDVEIIKEIASFGHEIGYHYEDIDIANSIIKCQSSKFKKEDLYDIAIDIFQENLKKLRKFYPVKTICMHGSPRSKFDNKDIWKKYDYRNFGIIGEPYFDIDFSKVLYLTDTGRMWDGEKVSVRDKVNNKYKKRIGEKAKGEVNEGASERRGDSFNYWEEKKEDSLLNLKYRFHSTNDIIKAANEERLPDKIMMTFHPQRWTDKPLPWLKELVWQNVKNIGKRVLIEVRRRD